MYLIRLPYIFGKKYVFGLNFNNPNRKIKWLPNFVWGWIGKPTYYD